MRILIADDSKTMRMIVMRHLRQAGYGDGELVEANNGAEALQLTRNGHFDLVLSDWNMPELNGYEFLLAFRGDGGSSPFGFVTSESTPEMKQMALDAGARFFITKPFTADTISEHLSSVLVP